MANLWLDIYTRPTDVKIFPVYDIQYTMTADSTTVRVAIMDRDEPFICRVSTQRLAEIQQRNDRFFNKISYDRIPLKVVIRDDHQHEVYHDDSAIIDICDKMFFGFMKLDISHFCSQESKGA
nr:MAG TPA: hypothetical protein [Siphoviridae sp. ct7JV2]